MFNSIRIQTIFCSSGWSMSMLFEWNSWNSEKYAKIFADLFWFEYTLQKWFVANAPWCLLDFFFFSWFKKTLNISCISSQLFVLVIGMSMIFPVFGFLKYISIKSLVFVFLFVCVLQSTYYYCPYNSITITVLNCARSLSKLFTFFLVISHQKRKDVFFVFILLAQCERTKLKI